MVLDFSCGPAQRRNATPSRPNPTAVRDDTAPPIRHGFFLVLTILQACCHRCDITLLPNGARLEAESPCNSRARQRCACDKTPASVGKFCRCSVVVAMAEAQAARRLQRQGHGEARRSLKEELPRAIPCAFRSPSYLFSATRRSANLPSTAK